MSLQSLYSSKYLRKMLRTPQGQMTLGRILLPLQIVPCSPPLEAAHCDASTATGLFDPE